MQIAVTGRISVRSWDDQNGQRRWTTEVIVEDQEFTESKNAFESRMSNTAHDGASAPKQAAAPSSYEPEGFSAIAESIDDDDLPF
jgi:single-strand DNA-binding protein